MAAAAAANGINLQYCTVQGRDCLQGTLYTNLMTIRVARTISGMIRWTEFLYGSRWAQAVGIWPWTDVFMSSETRNLLDLHAFRRPRWVRRCTRESTRRIFRKSVRTMASSWNRRSARADR